MKVKLVVATIFLFLSCIAVSVFTDDKNDIKETIPTQHFDIEEQIYERKTVSNLKKSLPPLNTIPLFLKVATLEMLLDNMKKNKKHFQDDSYQVKEDQHNLNMLAGRAAWLFEKYLDVKLAKITKEDDIPACRNRAKEILNAYRSGVIHASSKQSDSNLAVEKLVKSYKKKGIAKSDVAVYRSALKEVESNFEFGISIKKQINKYREKIIPGRTDGETVMKSKNALINLFQKWMPIGKRIDSLAQIVGERPEKLPKRRFGKKYGYTFDSGLRSQGFAFKVKSGKIVSVSVFGYV